MSHEGAGHREIDHTADLGFEVWAHDRDALFAEAVLGLCELCYELGAVRPRERREIAVVADSDEELLVRWLQEVYLSLETDGWLTARAEGVVVRPGTAAGVLLGEPYDAARHTLHTEIKAVTYHRLAVRREPNGRWSTTVIVDV